ncbi:hypothetical protein [Umezawaea sp.]|uniref:hypothetical protein n=1 Tax=Umezawaea sp. TaxID=1955258 RepID=UPI002ED43715
MTGRDRFDDVQHVVDAALAALRRNGVTIPSPWDARALCDDLAALRGRPVHLVPGSRFGWRFDHLWTSGDNADFIVRADRSSPVHQRHGVLHEIGHLVLGHACVPIAPGAGPGAPRPRLGYDDPDEVEAECSATTAGLEAEARPGAVVSTLTPEDRAAADRLAVMLGTEAVTWN